MPIQTILPSLTPLLNAAEENLHGHVAFVHRSIASMKVIEDDGLLLVDSGLRSDTFNKVCRARLRESEADRRSAEAIAYFRDVQRPFAWWVGPGSRPLDLESLLQDQGLRAAESELGMAMELGIRRVIFTAPLRASLSVRSSNFHAETCSRLARVAS